MQRLYPSDSHGWHNVVNPDRCPCHVHSGKVISSITLHQHTSTIFVIPEAAADILGLCQLEIDIIIGIKLDISKCHRGRRIGT